MPRYFILLPLLGSQQTVFVFFQFYSKTPKCQDMKPSISQNSLLPWLVTLQLSLSATDSQPSTLATRFLLDYNSYSYILSSPIFI